MIEIIKIITVPAAAAAIHTFHLRPSLVRALYTAAQHERQRELYLQKKPHRDIATFAHVLHRQTQGKIDEQAGAPHRVHAAQLRRNS
jgi:hypothetical protein